MGGARLFNSSDQVRPRHQVGHSLALLLLESALGLVRQRGNAAAQTQIAGDGGLEPGPGVAAISEKPTTTKNGRTDRGAHAQREPKSEVQ